MRSGGSSLWGLITLRAHGTEGTTRRTGRQQLKKSLSNGNQLQSQFDYKLTAVTKGAVKLSQNPTQINYIRETEYKTIQTIMAHSVKKRKQRERNKKQLERRVKSIARLAKKHKTEPQLVHLPHVSLGNLRRRYHPHNTGWNGLSPALQRKVPRFKRYPLDFTRPLEIRGSDGGLLAIRVPLANHAKLLHGLAESVEALPIPKHYKFKGIKRSEYRTVHYGTWAAYAKECMVTRELRDAGSKGIEFLETHELLWKEMSRVLGEYAPGVFKQFQLYPLNQPCRRFCGAWCACVVNNGGNNPNQTEPHRDVKEAQYGYSCIVSCGDFTGGALILYELEVIVEMGIGDLLLFPDSLITHANEPAEGNRISIVAFTQENIYDYWHREYNLKLRRQFRKSRK